MSATSTTDDQITLDPATAQSLTSVIHELATNAATYGCLSSEGGRLSVDWAVEAHSERRQLLTLNGVEAGGPPVSARQQANCAGRYCLVVRG